MRCAQLAVLTRLTELDLSGNRGIDNNWACLPPNLRRLDLSGCGIQQVPAELEGRDLQVIGLGL